MTSTYPLTSREYVSATAMSSETSASQVSTSLPHSHLSTPRPTLAAVQSDIESSSLPTNTFPWNTNGMAFTSTADHTPSSTSPIPFPTQTITQRPFCLTTTPQLCFIHNTYGIITKTTVVPIGTPFLASLPPTSSVTEAATAPPTPTRSSASEMSDVPPSGPAMTSSRSLADSTLREYYSTTTRSPSVTSAPSYTSTSWTTYTTANGSVIPEIVAQTQIFSNLPTTYEFLPDTTIPTKSPSLKSTLTNLPPVTSDVNDPGIERAHQRASMIVGAVVGSLIGIVLLVTLLVLCLERRGRARAPDYTAHRTSIWVPGTTHLSGSTLDLNSEPQPRASFVEPWTENPLRLQGQSPSRKIHRKMVEHQGGMASIATSSFAHVPRSFKTRARPQPQLLQRQESTRERTLSTIESAQETNASSRPLVIQPAPPRSIEEWQLPLSPTAFQGLPASANTQPRYEAIPPLYNEVWNVRRE